MNGNNENAVVIASADDKYTPHNELEQAYYNRLFVHGGAQAATDLLKGQDVVEFF